MVSKNNFKNTVLEAVNKGIINDVERDQLYIKYVSGSKQEVKNMYKDLQSKLSLNVLRNVKDPVKRVFYENIIKSKKKDQIQNLLQHLAYSDKKRRVKHYFKKNIKQSKKLI